MAREVWRLYTLPNHIFSIQSAAACPTSTGRSNDKPLFFFARTKNEERRSEGGTERIDRLLNRARARTRTRREERIQERESEGDGTKGWPIPLSGWPRPRNITGYSWPNLHEFGGEVTDNRTGYVVDLAGNIYELLLSSFIPLPVSLSSFAIHSLQSLTPFLLLMRVSRGNLRWKSVLSPSRDQAEFIFT